MKIQIGYEHFDKDGHRDIRLTPLDIAIPGIPSQAETLIGILVSAIDATDIQPGDGEADVKLSPALLKKIREAIPVIGPFLPADNANAFFKITH